MTDSQMEAAPISCALALQEMLIRHYGTADERSYQVERYGLNDAEIACQIEADARDALASDPVMAAARKMREALTEARGDILHLIRARGSEVEGSEEEWIGDIDAALSAASAAGIGEDQP